MRLCVIDLETTALDPTEGLILEIAAKVVDLPSTDPEILFEFYTLVRDPVLVGDHGALAMNSELLREIDEHKDWLPTSEEAAIQFGNWIDTYAGESTWVPAGKQVGAFDLQWLKEHGFRSEKLDHRCVDAGNLFLRETDVRPPSLADCFRRAFGHSPSRIAHRAEDDVNITISILNEGLQRVFLAPTIAELTVDYQYGIEQALQRSRAEEADTDV